MPHAIALSAAIALALACTIPAAAAARDPFAPAFGVADLDPGHTGTFRKNHGDETPQLVFSKTDPKIIAHLFFPRRSGPPWVAGRPTGADPSTYHYRLAFLDPKALGSMFATLSAMGRESLSFRVLRPGADYPGDPERNEDWDVVPVRQWAGHHAWTFPPGFRTRAVLLTERRRYYQAAVDQWLFSAARLHNMTPHCIPQCETASGAGDPMAIPRGHTWHNAGTVDEEQSIHRAPVSSVSPAWAILTRPSGMRPLAMRLRGNIDEFKLYAYRGKPGTMPALAPQADWERLLPTVISKSVPGDERSPTTHLIALPGVNTWAVKLVILETYPRNSQVARINEWTAWEDLGTDPVPPPLPEDPPPPVAIDYELPVEGEAAVVIDDPAGIRVRNLVAQVRRAVGANAEPWNMKDEDGRYVDAGPYTLRGICAPPLKLTYQHTFYPSVEMHSPNTYPWNTERPQDGWLANHGNMNAVCAVGDRVYIAASSTEGGHALAELDLQGNKLWGWRDGADQLFTDGKTLFTRARGYISRLDAKTHRLQRVLDLFGPGRRGSLVGIDAHDNQVVAAVYGGFPYLERTGGGPMNVDLSACLPRLPAEIDPSGRFHVKAARPQDDFLRLFRLTDTPAGLNAKGSLSTIPSTDLAGASQYVVLAFKTAIPLGSVVFPRIDAEEEISISVSALRPDGRYPPNPRREKDWIPFPDHETAAWDCLPAPEHCVTRALRITFRRTGEEGDLAELAATDEDEEIGPMIDVSLEDRDDVLGDMLSGGGWQAQLDGMALLRRRFRNLFPTARIHVNSGVLDRKTGQWDAKREEILWPDNPGMYVLEWDKPQDLAGLAIKELDASVTYIDVYTGPDNKPVDLWQEGVAKQTGDKWRCVAEYRQPVRGGALNSLANNSLARYLEGFVNFGREIRTRAVRLRLSEQWASGACRRPDHGGSAILPKNCRVFGVAPLAHVGGEPDSDVDNKIVMQRLATYDGTSGRLLREIPSVVRGPIAFAPDGTLCAIEGNEIREVTTDSGTARPDGRLLTGELGLPNSLDFDKEGNLYVWDNKPGFQAIKAFDPDGKYLRTIGDPGPLTAGPWNPARLVDSCGISVDDHGNIWNAYPWDIPRRVVQMRTDGTFVQEFMGNTGYGGGGVLDPYDKSIAYFKDLVFKLDRGKGPTDRMTSRVQALLHPIFWESSNWKGIRKDVLPIRANGRTYYVGVPLTENPVQQAAYVYLYDEEKQKMRMVAALGAPEAGRGTYFAQNKGVMEKLGGKPVSKVLVNWSDLNGDGAVQAEETEILDRPSWYWGLGRFDRQLGIMYKTLRFEVKKFLPNGVPVYHRVKVPEPGGLLRLDNGDYFGFGERGDHKFVFVNQVITPEGKRSWTYWCTLGVSGLWIPGWNPGQVNNQMCIIGHETAHAGELGEFVVISSNTGQWNIWTADGLLAGYVTRHVRDPRPGGFNPTARRGTDVTGMTAGQEHFHGFFCRNLQDDTYYIVAGGNHASIIQVSGFEKFRRFSTSFEVTGDMLRKTRTWDAALQRRRIYTQSPVVAANRGTALVDGRITEEAWGPSPTAIGDLATFLAAYNKTHLFFAWHVTGAGDCRSTAADFRHHPRSGGSVFVYLGADPDAPLDRTAPATGDARILITVVDGRPEAVLYRPVAPDAPRDQGWDVYTEVGGDSHFDQAVRLEDARVAKTGGRDDYTVEAAVPLSSLGMQVPPENTVIKFDWGVIAADPGGRSRNRYAWTDEVGTDIADLPTETRLHPDRWGYLRFEGAPQSAMDLLLDEPTPEDLKNTDIEDIFDDIEEGL